MDESNLHIWRNYGEFQFPFLDLSLKFKYVRCRCQNYLCQSVGANSSPKIEPTVSKYSTNSHPRSWLRRYLSLIELSAFIQADSNHHTLSSSRWNVHNVTNAFIGQARFRLTLSLLQSLSQSLPIQNG